MPIKELRRKGGFSDATFYKWRAKFGGMDVSDAKRLKGLEGENAKSDFQLLWPRLKVTRACWFKAWDGRALILYAVTPSNLIQFHEAIEISLRAIGLVYFVHQGLKFVCVSIHDQGNDTARKFGHFPASPFSLVFPYFAFYESA